MDLEQALVSPTGYQPVHSPSMGSRGRMGFAKPGDIDYNDGRSKDESEKVTDEVFNAASHLVGAMISLVASVWMITASAVKGNPWAVVSFSIYMVGAVGLFVASFLHHGVHMTKTVDRFLRIVDYVFIYVMIAGTYTPMCLVLLPYCWRGWAFLGVVWTLGIIGVAQTIALGNHLPKWLTVTWFGGMGGVGVIYCVTVFRLIGPVGAGLVIGGSVFYVAGMIIFIVEKPNPVPFRFGFHEIFHTLILFAAIIHQIALYFYVVPYNGDGTCP